MIKTTNIYSKDQAISLAIKLQTLKRLDVDYDISIVDGIAAGERVVSVTWDETEYEEALNNDEEF